MTVLSLELVTDRDVVAARSRARAIAESAGLLLNGPTRFATAVSEVARNAVMHGTRGTLVIELVDGTNGRRSLVATVRDKGPGVADPQALLDGGARGLGAARKMVDRMELRSPPGGGFEVELATDLPRVSAPSRLSTGPGALATSTSTSQTGLRKLPEPTTGVYEELYGQNRELARALEELQTRETELERVNRELDDTNRGVLALYAELDQRAELLARASETKSRFLSFMSHEFRTPLAAMLTLTELLAGRADGPLTDEQDRQVRLIRRSVDTLSRLVEDLLDLAKVEAGKLELRPTEFSVSDLFAALRGVLKNVPRREAVALAISDPSPSFTVTTDEDKLAQVLRNLVSNALKFTERGEVSLRAWRDGERALFECRDTGIGIAPADLPRIFDEFSQIDSPTQRKVRGTGLGLPIANKLVQLMQGKLSVESEPRRGSVFLVEIPLQLLATDRSNEAVDER